ADPRRAPGHRRRHPLRAVPNPVRKTRGSTMSNTQQVAQDTGVAFAKAAPALGVAATGATGAIDWSAVAYMLTALYMVLQILLLAPKYRDMLRNWKAKP